MTTCAPHAVRQQRAWHQISAQRALGAEKRCARQDIDAFFCRKYDKERTRWRKQDTFADHGGMNVCAAPAIIQAQGNAKAMTTACTVKLAKERKVWHRRKRPMTFKVSCAPRVPLRYTRGVMEDTDGQLCCGVSITGSRDATREWSTCECIAQKRHANKITHRVVALVTWSQHRRLAVFPLYQRPHACNHTHPFQGRGSGHLTRGLVRHGALHHILCKHVCHLGTTKPRSR
jgi:hypothetical protein